VAQSRQARMCTLVSRPAPSVTLDDALDSSAGM